MKIRPREHARWSADRMSRVALAATSRALLDLYCLEPGQEQRPHTHPDQDKIYLVLEGEARVSLDGAEETLAPGEVVVAKAGAAHGVRNPGPGRLLLLVVVAPPPPHA